MFADVLATENLSERVRLDQDVLIVGGGFYGACLALFLRSLGARVRLVEAESTLLSRASRINQARIHQGYHYPRSIVTGLRCTANYERFVAEFPTAVVDSFAKIYAIAERNSHVSANQFYGFCRRIGAPIESANPDIKNLFDSDLVEDVFLVREFAFDAYALREDLLNRLAAAQVEIVYDTRVTKIVGTDADRLRAEFDQGESRTYDEVYCCAYSGMNRILRDSDLPLVPLIQEVAELALIAPPPELAGIGVTLMDGPFFSAMPFPTEGLYSFTHVRYTPHGSWRDDVVDRDASRELRMAAASTNYPAMLKDATRYLPCMRKAEYRKSLYEIKTILPRNDRNDGRPILLTMNHGLNGLHLVLGGKIDNIMDVCIAIARSKSESAALCARSNDLPQRERGTS